MTFEISCEHVWREVSNLLDGEIDAQLRRRMEAHFKKCSHCAAVLDGTRNVISLVGDDHVFEVPAGFSRRLQKRIQRDAHAVPNAVPKDLTLGITEDRVALGSHLIYFWQNDAEFARGVRFLKLGLENNEYCVAFGHDEALEKVRRILTTNGYDIERLIADRKFTLLRRKSAAIATLSEITSVFHTAVRMGSCAIRFLGNLAIGSDALPGGEDDVLELEARVTGAARQFPCVVVCMYDVNTLPGRIVLKGGFETHPLAICGEHVQENSFYLPEQDFLRDLRQVH